MTTVDNDFFPGIVGSNERGTEIFWAFNHPTIHQTNNSRLTAAKRTNFVFSFPPIINKKSKHFNLALNAHLNHLMSRSCCFFEHIQKVPMQQRWKHYSSCDVINQISEEDNDGQISTLDVITSSWRDDKIWLFDSIKDSFGSLSKIWLHI